MANLKQHIQLQQQQQHQQQLQPPSPPPPPPPPPQQQKPGSSPLQPSWIPSSVRRNCDYCVKKKVSHVGCAAWPRLFPLHFFLGVFFSVRFFPSSSPWLFFCVFCLVFSIVVSSFWVACLFLGCFRHPCISLRDTSRLSSRIKYGSRPLETASVFLMIVLIICYFFAFLP